jgi:dephospho-CoA kinase
MSEFIVGLTGGIGSGKTAVSDRFGKLGVVIIDADIASRTIVQPGQAGLEQIVSLFGSGILLGNGELDRRQLRELVFSNAKHRLALEDITHPLIRTEIVSGLSSASSPYAILVSPLLMETQQHQLCQRILLVDVSEEVQLSRASQRDGVSPEQIQAIMAAQTSRDERRSKADDIIVNDRGLEDLDQQIAALHKHYLHMAGH